MGPCFRSPVKTLSISFGSRPCRQSQWCVHVDLLALLRSSFSMFQVEDDARRSVDMQLKTSCECLIFDVSHQISAPVMMLHAQMESSSAPPLDELAIQQALAGARLILRDMRLFLRISAVV